MSNQGFAFFVKRPRRIEELLCPHPIEQEQEYNVVKTIRLPKIDYENFTTDMLVDRQFLEDCILRSSAAAGAELNGSSAASAAALKV